MATTTKKDCGPQPSSDEVPNADWPLFQLQEYARAKNQSIVETEESLAVTYWQLGHALTLARGNFARGQWRHYLTELSIEKTRGSKAMAIYRTFSNSDDLQGKSVDVAYQQRQRKKKTIPTREIVPVQHVSTTEESDETTADRKTLQQFLIRLRQNGEYWVHEAAFVEPAEAENLIELFDGAMVVLQEIQRHLQQQRQAP